ncbi:MAG: flagellar export protein FliJ [Gammaproteobacteria bacterium]|nr:flagellar export protein FliJ [Gammaproteobacteria bacterium]MCW9031638.1 flagellar export protein FliJ [Gammaproteobacteria bacterium]
MALKRSERFKPIHNLAQQSEDVAAQTLGKIQRELSNHHLKLSELMAYYQDYTKRFNEQAGKGMGIIQVQSYQKFISQLEMAITEQKKRISRITEACNSCRADWNVERQKTQVLEKVITRYQKQEQQTFNRQEQRSADEFVANRFWHKDK